MKQLSNKWVFKKHIFNSWFIEFSIHKYIPMNRLSRVSVLFKLLIHVLFICFKKHYMKHKYIPMDRHKQSFCTFQTINSSFIHIFQETLQWNLVYPDTFVPEKISGYMRFPYIWNYLHMFFMLNMCILNKQLLIKILKPCCVVFNSL